MMTYSFSNLNKGSRTLQVFSTYQHDGDCPKYVIRVALRRKDHVAYEKERAHFAKIEDAERFHRAQVMSFVEKGYAITSSSCQLANAKRLATV